MASLLSLLLTTTRIGGSCGQLCWVDEACAMAVDGISISRQQHCQGAELVCGCVPCIGIGADPPLVGCSWLLGLVLFV